MILGVVGWRQPVHGYDVRRELLSWRADEWANIHPGSIYHALKKLTAEGLLREVATEQVGARPARTTYEITEQGRQEFETLLRRYLWEVRPATDPFLAAFAFLSELPRDEAAATLRGRAKALRGSVEYMRALVASEWVRHKPVQVRWHFERSIALAAADAAWCEEVAELVDAGLTSHGAGRRSEEHVSHHCHPTSNNQV